MYTIKPFKLMVIVKVLVASSTTSDQENFCSCIVPESSHMTNKSSVSGIYLF